MKANKTKQKYSSSFEKTFIGIFAAFTIITIVVTILSSIFLRRFTSLIHTNVEQRLIVTAELAATTIVSGDVLSDYLTIEDVDERYGKIIIDMRNFAQEHGLVYVYFMRSISEFEEQVILDSDPEEPLTLDYTELMDDYTKYVFDNGKPICMKLGDYAPSWYGIVAAYAPVFNSKGEQVAIVGVDLYDIEILSVSQLTKVFTWVLMICAVLLVSSAIILLLLFRRKARDYRSASIAKSDFLSRMSHEIRTPMNAIIGFSRMADKSNNINEVKGYLKNISDSSGFLLHLINSILDISKIEAGKMQLTESAHSPDTLVNNIYSMMYSQSEAKNINFVVKKEGTAPNYVYCDGIYLKQILINLLSNALKFTPENGEVIFSMKTLAIEGNRCNLEFSVIDNGIGISKASMLKVFEAFEQAEGGKTRKFAGTGLGLSISKLLVELMGGDLRVESEVGKGSKFWFDVWFNIVNEQDEPKNDEHNIPNDMKTVDLKGKTVLLFEDNEINQIIAENALTELGAQVEFAENGKIGLKMYMDNPSKYYFILMDIQMPEMDGYEATKRIRNSSCVNAQTIPIIAMSANVFKEDIEASLSAGMNAHIGKPFDMSQVVSTIYDVIREKN